MGDELEDKAAQNLLQTAYRVDPVPTTSGYRNASSDTPATTGLTDGPRSGAPFVGMFDAAPTTSAYKNGSDVPAPRPAGGMTYVPYKHGPSGSETTSTSTYSSQYQHGPSGVAPPPPPAWVEEDQSDEFKLKKMEKMFRGEDVDATRVRGSANGLKKSIKDENPDGPDIQTISTHYMSEAERKQTAIGADKDGKVLDSSGQMLDTTKASGTGTVGTQGAEKHIFVMTADGDVCQADPWANKKVTERDNNGTKSGHAAFINHSSFMHGQAVAGAGEIRVEKGELQQISDQSGHYQPDGEMVGQTLDQLDKKGVNMDKTSVKLVDKDNNGDGPIYMSPAQFREHDPEFAEDEIRGEKARLKNDLTSAVAARQARLGITDSDAVKDFEKADNGKVSEVKPPVAPPAVLQPLPPFAAPRNPGAYRNDSEPEAPPMSYKND